MIKAGSTWRGELHSLVLVSGVSDLGPYSYTSLAYTTPFDKNFFCNNCSHFHGKFYESSD